MVPTTTRQNKVSNFTLKSTFSEWPTVIERIVMFFCKRMFMDRSSVSSIFYFLFEFPKKKVYLLKSIAFSKKIKPEKIRKKRRPLTEVID